MGPLSNPVSQKGGAGWPAARDHARVVWTVAARRPLAPAPPHHAPMAVTSCPGKPRVHDDTSPRRGSFLTENGGVRFIPGTSHIGRQRLARSQR